MNLFTNFYKYSLTIFLSLSILVLPGCGDDDEPSAPAIVKLEESTALFSRSKSEMENLANAANLPELAALLNYDVKIYTITYKTDYLGKEIIASGLVTFPETDEAMPMMSFQHGTMAKNSEAPTKDIQTYSFLSSVASNGYIFLIPDFIGFGSSADILHPYYRSELTASSITDMMIAAKELATIEGYKFNGDAFLIGYSEGGYATMAAHKSIEENGLTGFNLVASAPSSGGYDVKGMQEYFFDQEVYDQPFYMAYVALAYKDTYNWDQPLSDYFQEPYATDIPSYFDGSLSGGDINAKLTTVVGDFLTADFLAGIDTDPKYKPLVDAFEENSLDNWVPTVKMYMYHGTADVTVPYQNSVNTYDRMIQAGASTDVVKFIPLEGQTHGSGFFPYLYDVLNTFSSLK